MLGIYLIKEIVVIFIGLVFVCLIPLLIRGPICMAFFYPKNIQERTISLGLTTQKRIKRNQNIFKCLVIPLYIGSLIISAYYINGARDFLSLFWQMATIAMAVNILDCFLIDELWVRKTNMWVINGTEDLKDEYVTLKGQKKRIAVTILILVISAILALIFSNI